MSDSEKKQTLFSEDALRHYDSPEKLDEAIRVIANFEWLFMAAGAIICTVLIWWGIWGAIDVHVTGTGLITFSDGTPAITTKVSGTVDEIFVKPNQFVQAGEKVAFIHQFELDPQEKTETDNLADLVKNDEKMKEIETANLKVALEGFRNQLAQNEQSIRMTKEQIDIYAKQTKAYEDLYAQGLVSEKDANAVRITLLNAQATLKQQEGRADTLRQSIESSKTGYESTIKQRELQISQQQNKLAQMRHQRELFGTIDSPYDGLISEISVIQGQHVPAGSAIAIIDKRAKDERDVATVEVEGIVYVNSIDAKKVKVSQPVLISPTIVRPSQYGSITGTVTSISEYPVTKQRLDSLFPGYQIDQQILRQGSVFEVHVALDKNQETYSGFHWTGGKGPEIKIGSGTMTNAAIRVNKRRPISYLLPFLRYHLTGSDSAGDYSTR